MVIVFWIIVGIILAAIFAPGLLGVVGMWVLLLALPILGALLKDFFSPKESSGNITDAHKANIADPQASDVKTSKTSCDSTPPSLEVKGTHSATSHLPVLQEDGRMIELRGIDKCSISVSRFNTAFECALVRDRNNSYDVNAIAVMDESGRRIAFVAREVARELAPKMDNGCTYKVTIVPGTYTSTKWGTCKARLKDEVCATPVREEHDPRLTQYQNGWVLRLEGDDGELSSINGVTYCVFTCSELMARDLGLEWVGADMKIGMRLSKEFVSRIIELFTNGDDMRPVTEIKFKTVVLLPKPTTIGDLVFHATVRGLESFKIKGTLVKTVQIPRLKDGMIYHMTDVANVESILCNGIMSKHLVEGQQFQQRDISDEEIQERREYKHETVYDRPLHDYASFYLNPRNAMLYRVSKHEGNTVVVIGVRAGAMEGEDYVVSDRNAAVWSAEFGNTQDFIDALNWDMIFSDSWNDGDETANAETKQVMQSEVLIPDRVRPSWISQIYCKDRATADIVRDVIKRQGIKHCLVRINRELFFEREYTSHGYGPRSGSGYRGRRRGYGRNYYR